MWGAELRRAALAPPSSGSVDTTLPSVAFTPLLSAQEMGIMAPILISTKLADFFTGRLREAHKNSCHVFIYLFRQWNGMSQDPVRTQRAHTDGIIEEILINEGVDELRESRRDGGACQG